MPQLLETYLEELFWKKQDPKEEINNIISNLKYVKEIAKEISALKRQSLSPRINREEVREAKMLIDDALEFFEQNPELATNSKIEQIWQEYERLSEQF